MRQFPLRQRCLGSITATTCASKDYPVRIEIIGTHGRVTLENNVVTLWDAEQSLEDDLLTDEDHEVVNGWEPVEHFGAAHQRQLRTIFRNLADGSQPPVSSDQARSAVDIILGIYESNRSGTRIMEGQSE